MRIQWVDERAEAFALPGDNIELGTELDEHRYVARFATAGQAVHGVVVFPDTGDDAFQLLSIQVDLARPGGREVLRRVAAGAEDLGNVAFDELRHFQVNGFTYFIAESEQGRLRLKLDPHDVGPADRYEVTVRILRLGPAYVASFRRHFLGAIRQAEARIRELESQIAALREDAERASALQRELSILRSSRAWRLAEWWRKAFYHQALGKAPRLRSRALDLSRRRVRREHGDKAIGALATNRLDNDTRPDAYQRLVAHLERTRLSNEAVASRVAAFTHKPTISVVMPVHDTPVGWLREAVESVLAQRYDNFELCICDDASTSRETVDYLASLSHPRVRIVRLAEGGHIAAATNRALELAGGDYVAFMDHDDRLDPDALFHVCEAINETQADVVYTDEDYLDGQGRRCRPNFKPDFSPDLLLSHNYITHLLVLRRALLDRAGGLDSAYDGCQDYDLVLRLSEIAESIVHVPRVLYHWRQSASSSSLDTASKPYVQERTRKLLADTMNRRGIAADILSANIPHFFYTRRRLDSSPPVSIIVPFRDEPALLEKCLNSVLTRTTYGEYEIIGVNNQSASPITFELMEAYRANPRIRFVDYDDAFNFSAIVNRGAAEARGDYLVLLNNDIEIITWQWLEEFLRQAVNPGTGAVGGKLYYPDNTIQHAGIVVGIDGYAGHGHKHFECHAQGYGNRLHLVQNVSAVTGAFMMVARDLFESVGGFDAREFPVACNDVDFCLRLIEAGYWNVFTPYARAYHLESASRGYEMTEEKRKRFEKEKAIFRDRHRWILDLGDPFYNPNLSLDNESFMVSVPRAELGQGE